MVTCRTCGGSGEERAEDDMGAFGVLCAACRGAGEVERGPIEIVTTRLRLRRPARGAGPCSCEGGWTTSPIYFSPEAGGWVAERVQCEECQGAGYLRFEIPASVPVRDRRPVPAPAPDDEWVDDDVPF